MVIGSTRAGERELGPDQFGGLVGRSPAMRSLFARCVAVAARTDPVLICGEAGTGKDLLARSLHVAGPRSEGPFVVLDCGVIAPSELSHELFGRAEGAHSARPGALELARGGSLLLDDVTALPQALQPRLSEALARRYFEREGSRGIERVPLDLRLITASRRRPVDELDRGGFSRALYDQIATHVMTLPALRERRDDLPLLARALLSRLDDGQGLSLTNEAAAAFALHDWPGNVRELRNVLERALLGLHAGGAGARLSALLFSREGSSAEPTDFEPGLSYREQRARFEDAFEKRYVAWLLERHDGNVSAAARAADMDRKYLYKLAKKHALKSSG